tara:strand:- start:811 stop:1632 length:822 start_codon:yes stop_codon:yes gene_type:complete
VGGEHAHRAVEPPDLQLFRFDSDSLAFKINSARDSCAVVDCTQQPSVPITNALYSAPAKLDHFRFFGETKPLTALDGVDVGAALVGAKGGGAARGGKRGGGGRRVMAPLGATERFLTFDYYPGRLNNQLWTLDWAFRSARAMGRTLYIRRPTTQNTYIGFPDRREDETNAASSNGAVIWDLARLRAHFRFVLEHELDGTPALSGASASLLTAAPATLDSECVYDDMAGGDVYIAQWMAEKVRNGTGKCRRLHLLTSHGMVHGWKTSTRKFGVE